MKTQYQERQGVQKISEKMEMERDQFYWAIRQLNHTRNPHYNQVAGRFSDQNTQGAQE